MKQHLTCTKYYYIYIMYNLAVKLQNLSLCLDKTYNIPICMWLMDTHPYNPPLIYVKPTATMQIKPGRHVDHTGRVYLPYLHEWKQVSVSICWFMFTQIPYL